MTDGFQRRREQSKADILKAARELFARFGTEKVSIADVARTAGVSQATIYNNFGSKDAVVREFVAGMINEITASVEAVLQSGQPFWEKISSLIAFASGMMANNRASEGDAVMHNGRGLLEDPEIRKIREAAEANTIELLLGLVAEGRAEGQILAGTSDDAYRIYFKAFLDAFSSLRFERLQLTDPKLVQDLGVLMIYGMHGASASTGPQQPRPVTP